MNSLKILHTSDWHLGKTLGSFSRLSEQEEFLKEFYEIVQKKSPHLILIAGDIFDNFNPPVSALSLFYEYIKLFSENGKRIVAVIAGNHDSPERLDAPYPLAIEDGIVFAGFPETELFSFQLSSKISAKFLAPSILNLQYPDLEFAVNLVLTAYANDSRLNLVQANDNRSFSEILEEYWQKKLQNLASNSINILMTHAFVAQRDKELPEEPDDEKSILSVGGAEILYTDQFPKNLNYIALGHLHGFQVLDERIVYSGSPLAYSFREAEQEKSVVYAELLPNSEPKIEPIPLRSGISLVRETFKDVESAIEWLQQNQDVYAEIYLELDEFLRSEDHRRLREAHPRLVQIIPKIKKELQKTHWRESIDLKQPIENLFINYFKYSTNQEPNEEILNEFREIQNLELEP